MSKARRRKFARLASALAGITLMVAAILTPATGAQASLGFQASGEVSCSNGWPVVGVWVNAGGSSGWASLGAANRIGYRPYSRGIAAHPTYTLEVGCGGTPSRWATSNHAQGGLLGMYGQVDYYVACNNGGSCSAVGYDSGIE